MKILNSAKAVKNLFFLVEVGLESVDKLMICAEIRLPNNDEWEDIRKGNDHQRERGYISERVGVIQSKIFQGILKYYYPHHAYSIYP